MLEFIDATAIANEISLLRDMYRGTVVIVEGPDDGCVFEKFKARDDQCRIVPAHGKENAINALRLLRRRGLATCVLVIVDADFWHLTGEEPEDAEVMLTEFHDLEMDIVASAALEDIVRELADARRVENFEALSEESLRTRLLEQAGRIGLARFVSCRDDLRLAFRSTDVEEYVDHARVEVDLDRYLEEVLEASPDAVGMDGIKSRLAETHVSGLDWAQVARGHDYASLLAIALRTAIASHDVTIANRSHVEMLLRLAYSREYFERGALARAIANWEDSTGCVVLD